MSLFFTSTSVVPVVVPWETRMRTLERLVSAPIAVATIIFGGCVSFSHFQFNHINNSHATGILIGASVFNLPLLLLDSLISSFCFSSLGALVSYDLISTRKI